jgi:hypothetical protein
MPLNISLYNRLERVSRKKSSHFTLIETSVPIIAESLSLSPTDS